MNHAFYIQYFRARQATDGNITRRMLSACWIHTRASALRTISAFPRQQRLRERASLLLLYLLCHSRFILFRGLGLVLRLHYQIFSPTCLVVFVTLYECTLKYMAKASNPILLQIALLRPTTKPVNFNKLCPIFRVPEHGVFIE
jgi:hypothetical protein